MKTYSSQFAFVGLFASFLLTGCVSQFTPKEITPSSLNVTNKHPATVLVGVTGGGKINSVYLNVENQTLQDAIADSITTSGFFSRAVTVGTADFQLDVLLVLLKQPGDGFTLTGGARMVWKLTRLQDHKQVFQDEIVTECRQTVGDHLVASTRARAAVAGSIQKNIQEGIEKMSKTSF